MRTLVYLVEPEKANEEQAWLNSMKVYPAIQPYYYWVINKEFKRFGVIVTEECAVTIKLRHQLQIQVAYKQR